MTTSIVDEIVAVRERWHTKRHPFFQLLADGKLPLRALGVYMALDGKFVQRALASFGIFYARTIAHEDVRKAIAENISEEEGFTEHAAVDVEHSTRQADLCARYLDTEALKARAREVAEQACMLRWASVTDLYRRECLGEQEILPPGYVTSPPPRFALVGNPP